MVRLVTLVVIEWFSNLYSISLHVLDYIQDYGFIGTAQDRFIKLAEDLYTQIV